MGRISLKRASCTSLGIVITALLTLLLASPAAQANKNGVASYKYKVTRFDYHATGQLTGGKFQPVCTPAEDALWEGDITTDDAEIAELGKVGGASLKIHRHGTSGDLEAKTTIESKFTATHRETTACENESESASSTSNCTGGLESEMNVLVDISGGVGTRVRINWNFFQDKGQGNLVPNTFECGEPFEFPDATEINCTKGTRIANLAKFTSKRVKLPFQCLSSTTTPPPGRVYTRFGAVANAKGALFLKRTKQR